MNPPKKYHDWERIFLDTCTIIEYLRASNVTTNAPKALFAKRLIDDLTSTYVPNTKKRRTIVISAISISEIITITSDIELRSKILTVFNASDVEIVPWSRAVAVHSNNFCKGYLSKKELNKLADATIPGIANKAVAREYLLKDYMLVTSTDFFKCDVVLTHDVNTFIPIAHALNFPSVEVNEDKFILNDTYIFGLK